MSDPAIKLFGRTIPLPEDRSVEIIPRPAVDEAGEEFKDLTVETPSHRRDLSTVERLQGTEQDEPDASSLSCSADEHQDCRSPKKVERSGGGAPRTKQLKNESDGSDQPRTALKKPDKLLPCPRCNSSDTKFCYYNNYNVNQPRHFCKNCQRYWTAGGTMRNVPVGAGRRKSKHAGAAHCRHLPAPPEAAPPPPQVDCAPCQTRTVLKFGADAPLCESMAAVLHLGDQKGEDPPAAAGSQLTEKSTLMEWPYLWAPGSSLQTGPFWGYGPGWPNKAWSFSWAGPAGAMPFPSSALGKHCRDSSLMAEEKTEKSLWIPKTLRIVDPDEAAKSSIWSTLGIKPDPDEHADKAGIFKGFQPKKGGAELRLERESVLHLNPAAFSRSQTFQEST